MIPFAKYHGAGNDFVLIDARRLDQVFDERFARRICDRRWGIGADGLLLLLPSTIADYRMRIFNADGSEPAMCGNGIRCLFDFIHKKENAPSTLKIETPSGVLKCRTVDHEVAVDLGIPKVLHWPIELPEGQVFVVDTGVPHAVVFVDDLDKLQIETQGQAIRFHPRFAPHGVNVNFCQVSHDGKIALRTYERGVGETLACGTGAAAAAYVALNQLKMIPPMTVTTRSLQQLRFLFPKNIHGETEIEMLGGVTQVFEGTIKQE